MIIKTLKTINNRYFKIFKFLFFLRYLFATFFIAILLFLTVPIYFDYNKKIEIIKKYLILNYNLELLNYDSVKYKIFPTPNLSLDNTNMKLRGTSISFKTQEVTIFLKIRNIYDSKDINSKKIKLNNNYLITRMDQIGKLFFFFKKLKNKLIVNNLNIDLQKKDTSLVKIKKISFNNYSYNKNKIYGVIFNQKFKTDLSNKNLIFEIKKIGLKVDLNLKNESLFKDMSGSSKINILNNYFIFDFFINDNKIKITRSKVRGKNFSIFFETLVTLSPFFEIESTIDIYKIDPKIFEQINYKKFFENDNLIKKFNSRNQISYNGKRSKSNLIKNLTLELDLDYGRLFYLGKIYLSAGFLECRGDSTLTDEYPRIYFDCTVNITNKNQFFKKNFMLKNFDDDPLNINIEGSLNILNKKVNIKKIKTDNNYEAKSEDLIFYKDAFENYLLYESFFGMFNVNKLRSFISSVI